MYAIGTLPLKSELETEMESKLECDDSVDFSWLVKVKYPTDIESRHEMTRSCMIKLNKEITKALIAKFKRPLFAKQYEGYVPQGTSDFWSVSPRYIESLTPVELSTAITLNNNIHF